MNVILGIDTSCYTTSAALVSTDGEFIASSRRLLTVAEGERGLQQSQGLFQHVKNLPDMIERVMAESSSAKIVAVCVLITNSNAINKDSHLYLLCLIIELFLS